ncbi:MAG: ArnT family glycosyltransferase [Promethearchaeota archaeon]
MDGGAYFPNDDSIYHIDAIQGVLEKGYPAGNLSWYDDFNDEWQSHKCAYYAHPPLFAYLAAIPALIFGRALGARIVSCTATTLAMFLLRDLSERYSPGSGIFAAILYGMNPVMFFYTSSAQFEPTVCFFGILAMKLVDEEKDWNKMLSGVAIGCAILTKESGVFFLLPTVLREFLNTHDWKSSLKIIIISGICAALFPILAWFTCWEAFENQFLFHFNRPRWPIYSVFYFIMNDALVIAPVLFCDLKTIKKEKDLSLSLIAGLIFFFVVLTRKYHPIALLLTVPLAILAGKGVQNRKDHPEQLFLGFGFVVLLGYTLADITLQMNNFCCIYNKYGYTLKDCFTGYLFLSLLAFSMWITFNFLIMILKNQGSFLGNWKK